MSFLYWGAIASKPVAKQEKQRRRLLPQSAFSIHAREVVKWEDNSRFEYILAHGYFLENGTFYMVTARMERFASQNFLRYLRHAKDDVPKKWNIKHGT